MKAWRLQRDKPHSSPIEAFRNESNSRVDYRKFIKTTDSWGNWVGSILLLVLLCFSTVVNLYYQLTFSNTVVVTFADLYSADKEWLLGADHTGPLNVSLIYTFIKSDNVRDVTHLKTAIMSGVASPVKDSASCVALVQHDSGSVYAFCDRLDMTQLPDWAQDFEALIVQTFFLVTAEQHRLGHKAMPYMGIAQAYRSTRKDWYEDDTIDRNYCTTKELATTSTAFVTRVLYTKGHGVLRNVDCSLAAEAKTEACLAINDDNPQVALFHDGTGRLRTFEVFRTEEGKDFILTPLPSRETIGKNTVSESLWPMDDCLYMRGDSIGWFGAGYQTYRAKIPTLALLAKLQLIGFLCVIWMVKFRCAFHRAHHALFQLSRLGLFVILVAQVLYSAYHEQDLMRTIYAWERRSASDWILFWYILSTISLAGGLLALAILRLIFQSSMCRVGSAITLLLLIPIALMEVWIAEIHYKVYNNENGLLISPDQTCPPGYVGCAPGKFNLLFLVILMAFVPAIVELIRARLRARST